SFDLGKHRRVSRNSTWSVHDLARLHWDSHGRLGGRSALANTERACEHRSAAEWFCANSKRIRATTRFAQSTHDHARGHEEFARKRQGGRGGAIDRSTSAGALSRGGESG